MKKLCVLVVLGFVLLGASCDTKNIGTLPWPVRLSISIVTPAGMEGGADATWGVNIVGNGPFTISYDFGGGAVPDTGTFTANGDTTFTVEMVNPSITDSATYNGSVTVTDVNGTTVTETFSFTVAKTPNQNPVIDSATFAGPVLTVVASDPDVGDTLTCTVGVPGGATVDATSKDITGGTATFTFSAADLVAGASGTVNVTVDDGNGGEATASADLAIAAFVPDPDTLYALSTSGVIVVITGAMANPCQYINGCGVTVESGANYAGGTFNVGAPGGAAGDTDGAWTAMNPGSGFLVPNDSFIVATDIGGGRHRIDFNVTPIGGSDQTGFNGMLFNFGLEGPAATYTLGFQDIEGVNRTYYTNDADGTDYFWGTLMAGPDGTLNVAGVDNTFTVN